MSFDTVEKIAARIFESPFVGNYLNINWHAGEPLVVPIGFYREALRIINSHKPRDVKLVTSFQTNGTLITEEWCSFFKECDARVGISMDGPAHIHNAYRVNRHGEGTFDRVIQGFHLLKAFGINPAVIMVVTERALEFADDVMQFFSALDVKYVGLNPEEVEGFNTSSTIHGEGMAQRYGKFFRGFIAAARKQAHPPTIRECERFLRHVRSGDNTKAQDNVPFAIVSFDYRGNVSTFSPELLSSSNSAYNDFYFGNVYTHSLMDVLQEEKFISVNAEIRRGVETCRQTCEYFAFCGGGSPSNKMAEKGTFDCTETICCHLRVKVTVDAIVDDFLCRTNEYPRGAQ